MGNPVGQRNPFICIAIVVSLAFIGLSSIFGSVLVVLRGIETPLAMVVVGALGTLGSGALGSLGSFLVSVPRGSFGGGKEADER